jgi:hypothetical protein
MTRPNKRMHTNRRPAFSFDATGFSDVGFAASARFQRRSVIRVVRWQHVVKHETSSPKEAYEG